MGEVFPIPEEAMRLACDAYDAAVQAEYDATEAGQPREGESSLESHAEIAAVRAAAPLIVAAELSDQADALDRQAAAIGYPSRGTCGRGLLYCVGKDQPMADVSSARTPGSSTSWGGREATGLRPAFDYVVAYAALYETVRRFRDGEANRGYLIKRHRDIEEELQHALKSGGQQ